MKKINLLIITIILFSCSTDDSNISDPPSTITIYRLVSETIMLNKNNTIVNEFNYDSLNDYRISHIISTSSLDSSVQEIIFEYNYFNQIITKTIGDWYYTYNYIEDVLYQSEIFEGSSIYYDEYYYDINGQMILSVQNNDCEIVYSYTNNNISNKQYNCDIDIEYEYTYDFMHNPYVIVFPLELRKIYEIGFKNIISRTEINSGSVREFEYEYNLENFPIKKTELLNGEVQKITTYEYQFIEINN